MPEQLRSRRRPAFTLVELLVVIAIIGVLVALLLPAIQAAREAARRMNCQTNLKNIALGCLNYESAKGTLPPGAVNSAQMGPDGRHSGFHVLILPFIEQSGMSAQAIAAIRARGENNSTNFFDSYEVMKLVGGQLPLYTCPSDSDTKSQYAGEVENNFYGASYSGVMGSYFSRKGFAPTATCKESTRGGPDDCAGGGTFTGAINFDGLLTQDLPIEIKSATDGMSNTLMVGERWYQFRGWAVGGYWTTGEPSGDPWGGGGTKKPIGPTTGSPMFAVKNIDAKYPLNADVNVVGCQSTHIAGDHRPESAPCTNKTMGVNNAFFGSFHSGGVNFALGDGAVKSFSDDVSMEVLMALASRNGDDMVALP